jgi:predicted negative regulator of RcsB-dependent stress response
MQKIRESENQKKNPAVYRVLGDGLMRQGKLQTALETYRKALKML